MTHELSERLRKLPEDQQRKLRARMRAVDREVALAPEARYEPFPLSSTQRAYLAGMQGTLGFSRDTASVYMELTFEGATEEFEDRLNAAFRALVRRHDALRVMLVRGEQQVRTEVEVPSIRIRRADGPEGLAQIRAAAEAETFSLASGDVPFRVWALQEAEDRMVVMVLLSALVIDGTSRFRLGFELHTLMEKPDFVLPDVPLSHRDCVLALHREKPSSEWALRLSERPPPLSVLPEPAQSVLVHTVETPFNAVTWEKLKKAAAERNIGATSLTTVAFCDALARAVGVHEFTLPMMSSYRPRIHSAVREVVGNFNTVLPVPYRFEASSHFKGRALRFQSELAWGIDHQDAHGLRHLREIAMHHGQHWRSPASQLLVNSVFDYNTKVQWRLARIGSEARYQIEERHYLFSIPSVAIFPTFGETDDGRLEFRFVYERTLSPLCEGIRQELYIRLNELATQVDAWEREDSWTGDDVRAKAEPARARASVGALLGTVRELWQRELSFSPDRGFFEGGADSLALLAFFTHIEEHFSIRPRWGELGAIGPEHIAQLIERALEHEREGVNAP